MRSDANKEINIAEYYTSTSRTKSIRLLPKMNQESVRYNRIRLGIVYIAYEPLITTIIIIKYNILVLLDLLIIAISFINALGYLLSINIYTVKIQT